MLRQDLRYALRLVRNSPGFTTVAVLSLALGIGANTAIFSIMDAVMLKYLPVRQPEQLVQVTMGKSSSFTNPIWEQLRDRQDVFSGVFAWGGPNFNLSHGGQVDLAEGIFASGSFFETLGVNPVAGRLFTVSDDRRGCAPVAVISDGFWQSRYGRDPAAVGRKLSLDGHPFEIIGVTQPGFFGPDVGRRFDVAVPICTEPVIRGEYSSLDQRSSWWLRVIGRLRPGISTTQARARLNVLAPPIFEATVPPKWGADYQKEYRSRSFETVPAASGLSAVRRQYGNAIVTLMIVVGLVLLIACANVANLMLARAASRHKEIAVRLAIGASRARLIRQLLTESLLLSSAGAAIGVLFAQWGSRLLVRYLSSTQRHVVLDLEVDLRVLGFTAAVAILTGVLFGLAPAFRGTDMAPHSALKEGSRSVTEARTRFGLGRMLVVLQVALSLILLVGAGLFVRSFVNLTTLDSGFRRENVLLVKLNLPKDAYPVERRIPAFDSVLEKVRAIPGVASASQSMITPISGSTWNELLFIPGYVPKSREDPLVYFNRITPGYFETMGTPLLAGRDFAQRDTSKSPPVAIVNETTVREFFGGTNPIGKTYRETRPNGQTAAAVEIVGVVKDAKYENLREDILPTAYVSASQDEKPFPDRTMEVRSATAQAGLIAAIKGAVGSVDGQISLNFWPLATQVEDSLLQERLMAMLSGFFGALALLIATIGLYGVMSYTVARRRNEIGIRMALGAERGSVLWLVLREAGLLLGAGVVIGSVCALATTHLAAKMLFGLGSNDPLTIAGAIAVLGAAAALAAYFPARRAAGLDPMTALRDE